METQSTGGRGRGEAAGIPVSPCGTDRPPGVHLRRFTSAFQNGVWVLLSATLTLRPTVKGFAENVVRGITQAGVSQLGTLTSCEIRRESVRHHVTI